MPQLLDIYMLRSFFYYFVLLTAGFILLFEVFTFFELLDDIAQHRTGLLDVINYFIYLACYLFYQLAPLAALVAVLVTLGVMTKNNELVAFKAGGISVYRISLPLLLAGLALATGLIVLDDTYLPLQISVRMRCEMRLRDGPRRLITSPAASGFLAKIQRSITTSSSTRTVNCSVD